MDTASDCGLGYSQVFHYICILPLFATNNYYVFKAYHKINHLIHHDKQTLKDVFKDERVDEVESLDNLTKKIKTMRKWGRDSESDWRRKKTKKGILKWGEEKGMHRDWKFWILARRVNYCLWMPLQSR